MTMLHDVSPIRLVNEAQIRSALTQAALYGGGHTPPASGRFDADGWVAPIDALDTYHRHVDGLAIRQLAELRRPPPSWMTGMIASAPEDVRRDALTGGVGGFPRDFEYIRSRMLEEKRQPLNAMRLFPRDGEVPLGAKSHTTRRMVGVGEAQIHRGGTEFPQARTMYLEETFGVAYVVCAVSTNFFESLTTDWAGIRQYQNDMRLAYRLVEERLNRIAFGGDSASNIAGVLNYPSLAKQVMSVAFDGTADPEDVTAALRNLVNTPYIQSGTAFQPNRLVVSPAIWAYISGTKHSNSGGTDTTIAEYFLRGQDQVNGIRQIDVAQELSGIGPNSEDGILAYRDDLDAVSHVLIQPPTTLPVYQSSPLDQMTVVFGATGGVVMGDVGQHILGYATV